MISDAVTIKKGEAATMIETDSAWKGAKFHSIPTDLVDALRVVAAGDNLAILWAGAKTQLCVNLPHGDGALVKMVGVAFEAQLNANVSWNDIDRVEITVVCGVERGPKTGTQAHLHLLASGLTVCETFPFGKSESTPLKQVLLEIPRDALNRERFPQISVFLILFAQRNDSTEGVLFSVDTIDFALRKK